MTSDRRWPLGGRTASESRSGLVRLRGVELDQARRVVSHRGLSAALTAREADLLSFLMTNPDRYFTAAELARHAWQTTDRSAEAVRVYVRRLRIKLAPLSLPYTLASQQWLGYRLAEVEDGSAHHVGGRLAGAVSRLRAGLTPLSAPVQFRALHASGSVAGLAGFLLAAAGYVAQTLAGHGAGPVADVAPALPGVGYLAALVAAPLMTLGWIAIYVRQSETAGVLGLAGFVLVVSAVAWAMAWGDPVAARLAQTPAEGWPAGVVATLVPGLGYLLMGVATLRARVFPRPVGWLLVAGALAGPLGALPDVPGALWAISRTPCTFALVWMSVLLAREAWTPAAPDERVPVISESGMVRP